MAAKRPRVMDSATTENLKVEGQIDWTIKNFLATWSACKKMESQDFKFYFPEVNKSFTFALIFGPPVDAFFERKARISMINRSSETLRMVGEVRIGSQRSFIDRHIRAGSRVKLFDFVLDSDVSQISAAGNVLVVRVMFSLFDVQKNPGLQEHCDVDKLFRQSLKALLTDTTFSDFTLQSGTEKFPCHKAILANRSDVFARLLSSNDWAENKNNLFQLDNYDPATVKQMLEFIYTNKLSEGSTELLLIADQFNMKDLISFCEVELSKTVTCQNAIKILNIADKVAEAKRLKDFVIEFIAQNFLSLVGTDDWKEIIDPNPDLLKAIKTFKV